MRSDPSIRYQPAIELLKLVIIHRLKLMPSNCFELSNIGQEKSEPRIQNIKQFTFKNLYIYLVSLY